MYYVLFFILGFVIGAALETYTNEHSATMKRWRKMQERHDGIVAKVDKELGLDDM